MQRLIGIEYKPLRKDNDHLGENNKNGKRYIGDFFTFFGKLTIVSGNWIEIANCVPRPPFVRLESACTPTPSLQNARGRLE